MILRYMIMMISAYLSIVSVVNATAASLALPTKEIEQYEDGRPAAQYRVEAKDMGVVFRHGQGPNQCDYLGARDVWVWQYADMYYMHYDGAGPKGWLVCMATSKDLEHWDAQGPVLDFGEADRDDSTFASYRTTFFDSQRWHMFYLGIPHTTPGPDYIPAFPYLTMKAEGVAPKAGPFKMRKN